MNSFRPTVGAITDVEAVIGALRIMAEKNGFLCESYGRIQGYELLALKKRSSRHPSKTIYISAGNHGDEPAPPLVILELLSSGFFDDRASWYICPMINPTGLAADCRENFQGIDLNRDYRNTQSSEIADHKRWLGAQPIFDLVLCLHEDWEASGYYVYELNPSHRPTLADALIESVSAVSAIDQSLEIDGRPAKGGILRLDPDPNSRELWPEAIYLVSLGNPFTYTLESASASSLPTRIAGHTAAIQRAVAMLCDPSWNRSS